MVSKEQQNSLQRLINIGIALSSERDTPKLMERILLEAKTLSNADGGTLYIKEGEFLEFEIIKTDSLNITLDKNSGNTITLPPVPLYIDGQPNNKQVASYAALSGETINIVDAYEAENFDFSGTQKFDKKTGYRSTSFLTVPLTNHNGECTGVLQLLNAKDSNSGETIAFSQDVQPLIEALASQAAVALENQQLVKEQKQLLDRFIELIASSVDAKSPYTGSHCQRVPELTNMITEQICNAKEGVFTDFSLNETEWYELHIAGLLHDCGKVISPEYVIDKATKLETITDRIHEIRTRFEVVKRDAEIKYLKAIAEEDSDKKSLKEVFDNELSRLDDDFAFIAKSNIGGEYLGPESIERIKSIANTEWTRTMDDHLGISSEELKRKNKTVAIQLPVRAKLLEDRDDHIIQWDIIPHGANPDNKYGFKLKVPEVKYNLGEVYNLCVSRGTLTDEERFKINDHMVQTIVMLEQLPFPKNLQRVPEYAGGHHETLIGTGFPKKLDKSSLSIPARVMAVADIFEALTASDRPYKDSKTLSQSIKIMVSMVNEQHIDADIFKLFLRSGIYLEYANRFLNADQIDIVDVEQCIHSLQF